MSYQQTNGAPGTYAFPTPEPLDPDYQPQRLRGREAPQAPPDEPSFEIKVDGVLLGVVYPMRLTGRAQFDLERAGTLLGVLSWMGTYAGGNPAQIEQVLAERPIHEIANFVSGISQALAQAIALGKQSGPR